MKRLITILAVTTVFVFSPIVLAEQNSQAPAQTMLAFKGSGRHHPPVTMRHQHRVTTQIVQKDQRPWKTKWVWHGMHRYRIAISVREKA